MTLTDILLAISLFTVSIETPIEIQRGWESFGNTGGVSAYASWEPNTSPPQGCIIHVLPLSINTINDWLHEIKHCTNGQWHRSK